MRAGASSILACHAARLEPSEEAVQCGRTTSSREQSAPHVAVIHQGGWTHIATLSDFPAFVLTNADPAICSGCPCTPHHSPSGQGMHKRRYSAPRREHHLHGHIRRPFAYHA
jgi:hypothetical protein